MAKICPLTGDTVLYLDCLECDAKQQCRKRKEETEMQKLFVSIPMRDRSESEIKKEMQKALEYVNQNSSEKFTLIDTFFPLENGKEPASPIVLLGKSLQLLDQADLVIFMPGWDNSRGCLVEHTCVCKYNIKHTYYPSKGDFLYA